MPQRIRLSRRKGWRKPEGAIVVARPGRWGNPYVPLKVNGFWCVARHIGRGKPLHVFHDHEHDTYSAALSDCIRLYRWMIERAAHDEEETLSEYLAELRGHDLACWCPLDEPCHADVLLDLANRCANA